MFPNRFSLVCFRAWFFFFLIWFIKGKSQCPYPGDPPNGLIAPLKFHYDPGDYLSVQCRPGFVEVGTNTNGPPERPRYTLFIKQFYEYLILYF